MSWSEVPCIVITQDPSTRGPQSVLFSSSNTVLPCPGEAEPCDLSKVGFRVYGKGTRKDGFRA